ncbi:Uncharacterized protein dnm_100110 [Desulfonema magnum]|uniref:Uncharacterized protein n=1 Tax=Desulfonema magnum TaxID=45655 RepID=A0A975C0D4_9BACT|nr:Uncharacterized protein dnm_100110 [Desulfonema magnum]
MALFPELYNFFVQTWRYFLSQTEVFFNFTHVQQIEKFPDRGQQRNPL